MTNILKDVWEDRSRGACWLPQEVFSRYGSTWSSWCRSAADTRFDAGMRELVGVAHVHLRNALAFTLLIPGKETGIRRFCLWAIGLAVLTLRKIADDPGFTSGAQVKVSHAAVRHDPDSRRTSRCAATGCCNGCSSGPLPGVPLAARRVARRSPDGPASRGPCHRGKNQRPASVLGGARRSTALKGDPAFESSVRRSRPPWPQGPSARVRAAEVRLVARSRRLDQRHRRRRATRCQAQQSRWLLAVRARGRLHDSGRIHPDDALPGRDRSRAGSEDRRLPARTPGRSRRLAAVSRRRVGYQRTVKAYYALKLAGDDPDAPHMQRARNAILERGGAARSNVFTRIALALFGEVPWRAVPVHSRRDHAAAALVSVPSRQGVVLVAHGDGAAVHPVHRTSRAREIRATCTSASCSRRRRRTSITTSGCRHRARRAPLARAFFLLDRCARSSIRSFRRRCARRRRGARKPGFIERLNGEDGLGAIFPAMVNSLEAMVLLGYPRDNPHRVIAKRAIEKLLVIEGDAPTASRASRLSGIPPWPRWPCRRRVTASGETARRRGRSTG